MARQIAAHQSNGTARPGLSEQGHSAEDTSAAMAERRNYSIAKAKASRAMAQRRNDLMAKAKASIAKAKNKYFQKGKTKWRCTQLNAE